MGADASIYQQFLHPVRSVQDYSSDMDKRDLTRLQLQGQMGQNALLDITRQQQGDKARQDMSDQNAIQQAARGAQGNSGSFLASLRGANATPGTLAYADAREKAMLDNQKTQADVGHLNAQSDSQRATAGKTTQDTQVSARRDAYASAASLNTPEDAIASLNEAVRSGKVPMQVAQGLQSMVRSDPLWKLKLMQGALDPDKLKEALMPHFTAAGGSLVNTNPLAGPMGQGQANAIPITQSADNVANNITSVATNAATNATSRATNAATVNATYAGQNLTDARERGKVKYETDGNGNLVALPEIATPGGIIKAGAVTAPGPGMVPMQGKDVSLNQDQSKALSFGSRMSDARVVIQEMETKGVFNKGGFKAAAQTIGRVAGLGTDSMGGTLADAAGNAMNWSQSEQQQRYEGAKQNWIAAQLRKESGAAIGAGEYRDADNQYFPQPADNSKTIADKVRRRRIAEDTMLAEVPRGKRNVAAPAGNVIDFGSLK